MDQGYFRLRVFFNHQCHAQWECFFHSNMYTLSARALNQVWDDPSKHAAFATAQDIGPGNNPRAVIEVAKTSPTFSISYLMTEL